MATAYFDVDGTLVATNLLHPTWHYLSNQATPARSALRIGKALLNAPKLAWAEVRDRRSFNELLFAHYRGMSEDRLVCLADEIFQEVALPRLRPGSVDLVNSCKAAGMRVVLITGSLDLNTAPLLEHLGADAAICNRLEFKDGYATGKLLRPVVAGPGKARLIADDARQAGHDLAHCHGYSDSFSDVPMLSLVGHAYCVHPDSKLERLAKAYDWPILDLARRSVGETTSRANHA